MSLPDVQVQVQPLVKSLDSLKVRLFADGADLPHIATLAANPLIQGFTTNPTLMRAAGVQDYELFARDLLKIVSNRPVSFEVFADDFPTMERQARKIARWGRNVYVKVPITNTKGESALPLVKRLSQSGIKVNVTAVMEAEQAVAAADHLAGGVPATISIFAGRIADTGRDPLPILQIALERASAHRDIEIIWASPRELLNVFQADQIGCHIITATKDILGKLHIVNKNLREYSLETVRMFYEDAARSGFIL